MRASHPGGEGRLERDEWHQVERSWAMGDGLPCKRAVPSSQVRAHERISVYSLGLWDMVSAHISTAILHDSACTTMIIYIYIYIDTFYSTLYFLHNIIFFIFLWTILYKFRSFSTNFRPISATSDHDLSRESREQFENQEHIFSEKVHMSLNAIISRFHISKFRCKPVRPISSTQF